MEPTERIELPTPRFMEHPVCYAQTFQDYKARVLLIKLWVHKIGFIFINHVIYLLSYVGIWQEGKDSNSHLTVLETVVLPIKLPTYMVRLVGFEPTRHNDTGF